MIIRAIQLDDRAAWDQLFRGYRDFYLKPHRPEVYETVWSWLMNDAHETRALVAENDSGELVGFAHYRTFARSIDGGTGIFLDDLFTDPDARGSGIASQLIHELAAIAEREGASLVRWITAEDNETARRLYEKLAKRIPFVTYDIVV